MSEKSFLTLSILGITLFNFLLSLQGFDMCDEGWVLTGYQQFFNDPSSVEYLFLYYSAQLTGGLWYLLFGNGGILSFRILAVLTLSLSFYLSYFILKEYINRIDYIIGIFIISFCHSYGVIVFHHNYFTLLLYCMICLLFYKALVGKDYRYMIVGGFILGIEFFARIPNLSLLGLMIVFIPFTLRNSISKGLTLFVSLISGIILGCFFILIIMFFLGHVEIFRDCLLSGFSAAESSESTHNWQYMLQVYKGNYVVIAECMIAFILLPLLYIYGKGKIINYKRFYNVIYILLFVLIYLRLATSFILNVDYIYIVYGLCTFWLAYGLYKCRDDTNLKYLILISFVILYFLPLGSDFGVGNMGPNCIWIAVPLSVSFARKCIDKCNSLVLYCCSGYIVTLFFVIGLIRILSTCYFDNGWRWEKTYMIDSSLATTFTTIENKRIVDELMIVLQNYVRKDDYVLFFQSIATLHFLTETKPYLGNPWPWTYDPFNIETQFVRAKHKHSTLPIIVRQKSNLTWQKPYDDWNNDNAITTYSHKNGRIKAIKSFIRENRYEIVWENDLFQILKASN